MNRKFNKSKIKFFFTRLILVFFLSELVFAQNATTNTLPMKYWTEAEFNNWLMQNEISRLFKTGSASDRREGIMDGNKIRTVFYNYGSIGRPNTEPSVEWPNGSNNGYAYEFGPIIGAEVVDVYGDTIAIVSDALIDGGDRAPSGKVWGWQPLPQYLNSSYDKNTPAMSNAPDSWPQLKDLSNPFYNPNSTGPNDEFLWPGIDTLGQISGDLEAYWVMDDRDNDEYEYYPFENDSSRRGLGLELTCRLLQFSATPAEDVIFYIIEMKNVSDKKLNKVVAGMFGDPHIGGAGDFSDDMAGFNREKNMVYSWDKEGSSNDFSIPWTDLGWLGFKFLESPKDSIGNELGLTSMTAPVYATTGGNPSDDGEMWRKLKPGSFNEDNIAQESDNVFLFGTGYFKLDPGESQRFSIAIVMGKGLDDLLSNGDVAQDIYNRNYQFTKAPDPPNVTAVPGDGQVTIYWDTKAEESVDEFFGAKDFEGYKLYKSSDKGLTWGEVLTNAHGLEVGYIPIEQWDIDNGVKGLFPYDKDGVKFYLGKDNGLVHYFTDNNVINGVNYYYAVTSYDSGYVSKAIHPVESGRFLGKNVVSVVPSVTVPGYENAKVMDIIHTAGISTAKIDISVLDPQLVNESDYEITFDDTTYSQMVANIINQNTGERVVKDYKNLSGFPVIFDGLNASITNETVVQIIDSITGWTENSVTNVNIEASLYPSGGVRFARDLEFRFFDTIVDTSIVVSPKPVNFEVWDVTVNEKMDFIFFDNNNNSIFDIGDRIVPITYVGNTPKGTWQIVMTAPNSGDPILPTVGDVFELFTAKFLTADDKYKISTQAATISNAVSKEELLDNVIVVPNPYVASSSFETPPPSVFSAGRGERRIYFMNIPEECTIRIFTLNSELIRTLEHSGSKLNGTEPWDLLTEEGLDISYGVYVYHIDAGEYGEKIGKFAIIK